MDLNTTRKKNNLEHRLQSEAFLAFDKRHPELRGRLFATFQETTSPIQGSQMNSMGLIRGVSDMIFSDNGEMVGIEWKAPETQHKVSHLMEQAHWLMKNTKRGYFCDSIEMFWDIIYGGSGIDPKIVFEYCSNVKKSQIIWKSELFKK